MKLLLLFSIIAYVHCFGHWRPIAVDHESVVSAANFASKSLSNRMNYPFHGKLAKVHRAESQIVAGVNYRLEISLGITVCKKNAVDYDKIETCDFQDGMFQKCNVVVYKNLKQQFKLTKFECKPEPKDQNEVVLNLAEETMFKDFVSQYKKEYKDKAEVAKRFKVFQANLKKIKLLNDHERGTAHYGVTEFADLTEEEFKKTKLGLRPDLLNTDEPLPKAVIPNDPIPTSYDWRDQGVVTEVKNQGQCGSCWAFSTTGNIEGQWAIKKTKLVSLSEQELVDCDKVDEGCEGGLPSNAYKEIIRLGGLEGEKDYPYEGTDDKCELKKKEIRVYINSSLAISSNETEMAQWLVKNGPISIGINANAMQFYFGGVSHPWKFLCSPSNIDHGVLIVGYGVHTYPIFNSTMPFWIIKNSWGATWGEQRVQPYWIIKNSWGASWGEQGYYRVFRGDGTCGLNTMATSAVVD